MDQELNYEKVEKAFVNYVETYQGNDKRVWLKKRHSFDVANLCKRLASSLYWTKDEINLAEIIGLLHDIGRFEQLKQTNSFDDSLFDHADYAVSYLFKKNMHIKDFLDTRSYDDVIRLSIYYHNKLTIPKKDPITDKFMKLIRDCDKIGIYYATATNYELVFDGNVTDRVLELFEQGKMIPNELCKTESDSIIRTLAFLYDLNYEESFDLLQETDYLGIYLGSIEVKEHQEDAWNKIKRKVYDKLDGGIYVREEI